MPRISVDQLLGSLPQSTRDRIKTYFNKRITGQTTQELHDWLQANVSKKQYDVLVGENFDGLLFAPTPDGEISESVAYTGLKQIWNSIYNYKQNLARQLEQQVQNVEEYVNGMPAGEGFVYPSTAGLVKIVDRTKFSAANFAKNI